MRLPRRTFKKARIEIIPMIDTIFFLLVFFMISTLSMAHYSGLPVNLPTAASGRQPPSESLSLTITKEGRILIDKQPVERRDLFPFLKQRFQQKPDLLIIINADHEVEHGVVVEVMDEARQAGVAKMAIAVKPK
jgi:biopolymer transport protein ExbD